MNRKIGIIGGSGLDDPSLFDISRDVTMNTPYGEPSSSLREGSIGGVPVALMARHGRQHTIPPTQVNYRANLWALKEAGCTHVLASTAVGSLREEIERGDLVIPDQFIDFTRSRALSFFEAFEPGKPMHVAMADPFDAGLRRALAEELAALGYRFHDGGTVVTIEGPRFSTRAESRMFRAWGADIINMSVATEAIMANELGIPYAAIAMSTDYDSWKEDDAVMWEAILAVAHANAEKVLELFRRVIPKIG
ncbi:S-methyl-5'-thioadenosine phosphorylase [Mailhella sp.]|uniref:S-methyl-5'-thioadenosine phosphorylase n=1 Tax=Mailhella sp. TaxID=1981029 RepID=UPI003AB88EF3